MITRRHAADGTESQALYSDCETYRYSLTRIWGAGAPVLFVMLNPSTATELRNDPTIERCERRARAMGHGGVSICNLFAFRATRPTDLKSAADPVGSDNDATLLSEADRAERVICAWGVHGAHLGRGAEVARRLADHAALLHFGLTKGGHPRHPLYVPYAPGPKPWAQPAVG